MRFFSIILGALYFVQQSQIVSASSINSRYKFQKWFSKYQTQFSTSAELCRKQIERYQQGNRTECKAPCACAVDCILEHTSESMKTNMAGAVVVLGLTPSILAMLGFSMAETAVLSTERPLLSLLLSLGAPAIFLGRLFDRSHVTHPFQFRPTALSQALHAFLNHRGATGGIVLSASEYLLAFGATANVAVTSIDLDWRTASGWRCGQILMPLMWSLSGAVVHLCAIIALRMSAGPSATNDKARGASRKPTSRSSWIAHQLRQEWMPCLFRDPRVHEFMTSPTTDIIYLFASFLGAIHMIFGVMVFSSLLFISMTDALHVLGRYAVSACVCRAILMFELAGIQIRNADGSTTPDHVM